MRILLYASGSYRKHALLWMCDLFRRDIYIFFSKTEVHFQARSDLYRDYCPYVRMHLYKFVLSCVLSLLEPFDGLSIIKIPVCLLSFLFFKKFFFIWNIGHRGENIDLILKNIFIFSALLLELVAKTIFVSYPYPKHFYILFWMGFVLNEYIRQ